MSNQSGLGFLQQQTLGDRSTALMSYPPTSIWQGEYRFCFCSSIAMSRAGSKKDTVIGAARLKNAVILVVVDWRRSSIFIHAQYLSDISIPPPLQV